MPIYANRRFFSPHFRSSRRECQCQSPLFTCIEDRLFQSYDVLRLPALTCSTKYSRTDAIGPTLPRSSTQVARTAYIRDRRTFLRVLRVSCHKTQRCECTGVLQIAFAQPWSPLAGRCRGRSFNGISERVIPAFPRMWMVARHSFHRVVCL